MSDKMSRKDEIIAIIRKYNTLAQFHHHFKDTATEIIKLFEVEIKEAKVNGFGCGYLKGYNDKQTNSNLERYSSSVRQYKKSLTK